MASGCARGAVLNNSCPSDMFVKAFGCEEQSTVLNQIGEGVSNQCVKNSKSSLKKEYAFASGRQMLGARPYMLSTTPVEKREGNENFDLLL
jgi:hypothetical protein